MAAHPVRVEKLAVKSSGRKLMSAHLFEHVAVTVSDGGEYGLQEMLRPQVTLSHARAAWKWMGTSLAAVVVEEREHS